MPHGEEDDIGPGGMCMQLLAGTAAQHKVVPSACVKETFLDGLLTAPCRKG